MSVIFHMTLESSFDHNHQYYCSARQRQRYAKFIVGAGLLAMDLEAAPNVQTGFHREIKLLH
ncbi:MAG: hypothetical protein JWR17_139 [Pseudomonas sp.]|jgi:hypothetical protein|uniref:hypothetical protein n=1 Tax=Pseudomonas sp. TaxID=306 RepID=UPI0026150025|nr:hypothetical protein [Pseudomonas sp.]MDB6047393.1 hypothetical protein [Pseudomonas sp.]